MKGLGDRRIKLMVGFFISLISCLFHHVQYVFAFPITPNVTPDDFNTQTLKGAAGVILGTVFWLLRLIGIVLLLFGLYTAITAKKDGDASEINNGQLRIIFGVLFLAMPQILKGLKIIV